MSRQGGVSLLVCKEGLIEGRFALRPSLTLSYAAEVTFFRECLAISADGSAMPGWALRPISSLRHPFITKIRLTSPCSRRSSARPDNDDPQRSRRPDEDAMTPPPPAPGGQPAGPIPRRGRLSLGQVFACVSLLALGGLCFVAGAAVMHFPLPLSESLAE